MVEVIECGVAELLERIQRGEIPMTARVRLTVERAAPPDPGRDATLALFEQWEEEDSHLTAEQQAENERVYLAIEKSGIPRMRV